MKRLINYLFMIFIFIFVFNIYANAECSYQERKDLLDAAKNVDISFDINETEEKHTGINPNTGKEETSKSKVYYFKMNIIGNIDNMFLKITNDFDAEEKIVNSIDMNDNAYSFEIKNSTDIINYKIDFYSRNNNCYAENITTKRITKPKENLIYYYSICSNDLVSENKYCKQFIDKDFNMNEFEIMKKLNKIIEEETPEEINSNFFNKILSFIVSYWYVFALVFIIIITFAISMIIRKKRSRL